MSANITIASRPNPYIGTRPYKKGETLYGREQETYELLDLLIAQRIVMLYSPSGAGKSSLLNAAILPQMETNGFEFLPLARVNQEPPATLEADPKFNRYAFSLLTCFEEGFQPAEKRFTPDELATLRLKDYLARYRQRAQEQDPNYELTRPILLIIDQGEEIITIAPTERDQKQDFFDQLAEMLFDRSLWLLYSLREDYVARLDSYIKAVPTGFATRYRLRLLQPEGALAAIQRPPEQQQVTFTNEAANQLATDLRVMQVQQPDGSSTAEAGLYVEPVLLQVVCQRLWNSLKRNDNEIGLDDLTQLGNVNTALADYYSLQVATVAARVGVRERAIREWFNRKLITQQGIRGQVLLAPDKSDGLENAAIHELERSYLVRSEKRGGSTWFELSHDRLIQPVLADNAAWFEKTLSMFQRAADVWNEQGRSEGLLLFGKDFLAAEQWAIKNKTQLLKSEQEFLEACRKYHQHLMREKRNHQIVQILLGVSLVAFVIAVAMAWRAYNAEILAETRQLAADSISSLEVDPELGVLLALEAMQKTDPPEYEAIDAMHRALPALRLLRTFTGHTDKVYSVSYSPDGKLIASASLDGTIKVWEVATGKVLQDFSINLDLNSYGATAVTFSPDGTLLAGADGLGDLFLWETTTWQEVKRLPAAQSSTIWGLVFSPDGKTLATAGSEAATNTDENEKGLAKTWSVPALTQLQTFSGHSRVINAVAFNSTGTRLATASDDSTARVWDAANGQEIYSFPNASRVMGVAFGMDDNGLASTTTGGNIWLWNVATGDKQALMRVWGHEDRVYGVAFKRDGSLISSGADRTIRVWDGKYGRARLELRGHTDQVYAFAMNSAQTLLASASADRTVRLWDISWVGNRERFTIDNQGYSQDVDYSPAGDLIASPVLALGKDGENADPALPGSVALFDAQTGALKTKLTGHTRGVTSVDFSPDGKRLVSSSWDKTAIVWDVQTGQALLTLTGHDRPVLSADYNSAGTQIATSDRQGLIKIWDATSGSELKSFEPKLEKSYIDQVQFSTDGKLLAVVYHESYDIYLLDPETGELKMRLSGHEDIIRDFDFSPDGTKFVSVGDDAKIIVWGLRPETPADQRLLVKFGDHIGTMFSVTFSADGRELLSGGADGRIKAWAMDGTDGKHWVKTATLYVYALGDEDTVLDVEFSPNGTDLVAVIDDWTVRGYILDDQELAGIARQRLTRGLTCFERTEYLGEVCQP